MGSIKYPKEKIADVNQASFQSFFIMIMPLACVSDYDSQALNFASVDQESTAFEKVKSGKLFRRYAVRSSTSLSLWDAVRLGSCQSASLLQTHAKASELEYDYD